MVSSNAGVGIPVTNWTGSSVAKRNIRAPALNRTLVVPLVAIDVTDLHLSSHTSQRQILNGICSMYIKRACVLA
jgi:hypothetical protein